MQRSTVFRFRQRHYDEVVQAGESVAREVMDYAIASKVNRIAALNHLYNLMAQEIAKNGVVEQREGGRVFNAKLVREMRGVLKDVAVELGQLPRSEGNENKGSSYVFMAIGADPDIPLG